MRLFHATHVSRRFVTPLGCVLAIILAFSLCRSSFGQTFTSSITGTVTDPSGGTVNGARVELKNMSTNDVHQFTTLGNGAYQFNNLLPGTYQITVTAPGFQTYVQQNLVLQAQINSTVNISLTVGNTQQKIEVTASAVLVDTQTANNQVTLDAQLIQALPNNTRNPLNFVFAVAGTTPAPSGSGQTQTNGFLDQMSSNFGLNGGRTGEEEILIDGAPSQAIDWGGLMVSPLQDSVQEQQIVQNSYDAQYQRAGAGIVTLITKSGATSFHGEAYDYLQNDVLNANSWSNNKYGIPKGPFKQNQFGGNVGGPILKRWNLFFFGGYEGFRQPSTQSTITTVPTAAERSGDFSAALNSSGGPDLIYNPFTTTALDNTGFDYTRTQFPGNKIPSTLINPVGQKIVNLYPNPNRPSQGPNELNNFSATGTSNILNDKLDTRVDWEQSAKHRLFVRWSDRFRQNQTLPCFFCTGGDTGVNQANNGFQVVLDDTVTPNPNWVIDTYISYSRWKEAHISQDYGTASPATIGLPDSLFQAPILPGIVNNDGTYSNLGVTFGGGYSQYIRYSNTSQINLTKVFNRHTLKFGGNYDVEMINSISESNGSLNFSSALTSCDPNPAGGPCLALNFGSGLTGNPIASMLLGTASGGGQSINIDPAMSIHIYGTYVQDQWRANSRLTLNFGLRYENQRPATERHNRLMFFDPNVVNPISNAFSPAYGETIAQVFGHPLMGAFEYAGQNGNGRYAWAPDNTNFAPRAGFAFRITDKLVARAGAGIFFLPASAMITFDNPGQFYGFSSSTTYIATTNNGFTPLNLVNNPFPQGITQPSGSSQGLLTLVGNGLGQIWPKGNHPTPYTEDWSFDLQYQINPHSLFEIGYNGNRGRKLLYGNPNLDADQLPDQFLALGNQLNAQVPNPFAGVADPSTYLGSPNTTTIAYNEMLRPFPQFTYLQWTRSLPGARSSFNALEAKYNYRFNAGLSLLVTYQWSKALDNGPEDFFGWATGNSWRDAYNTMLDYNISTHDVPQSFATALVYDLPYGRGKHWGNNAPFVVKEILGNWQLGSIVKLASGLPIGPVVEQYFGSEFNNFGYPEGQTILPDIVSYNISPANRNADNWINPANFVAPPSAFVMGNEPQRFNQLRTRALRNVDLSIAKNLGGERFQAWLRGEFLNAFNYAQYNNFCLDLSENSCFPFGGATNTENSPRTIQVSLKLMF